MNAWRVVTLGFLVIVSFATVSAQRRDNVWYFGYHAGIDFNSGAPVPLVDGQTNVWEGTSVVCDPVSGRLLFYTDGVNVWNRNHAVMPNGTGLLGNSSSAQGALIVQQPGSDSLFFVFTSSNVESGGIRTVGVNYSVVDMSADSGRGSVVQKNRPVLKPAAEKLQAVRHCNGRDYWILMVEWGTNRHHAWLLTQSGLSPSSVVTPVGPVLSDNNSGSGYLVASHDGRRLGMALNTQQSVTLFDFNNGTGIVSNAVTLDARDGEYGIGFSPDNSKLYVSGTNGGTVVQYDLSAGSPAAIRASKVLLQSGGAIFEYGAFKLGPDGRLYMARSQRGYSAVIRNPNLAGVACGYVNDGFQLGGKQGGLGFPNTPVDPPPGSSVHADAGLNRQICQGSSTQLQATGGTTYRWSPTTGLSCTNCPNPIAQPSTTTTYYVYVDEGSGCPGIDSVVVAVIACADTGDYIYQLPDLCVGQTRRVLVPYHHRWYQDTVETISISGKDADLFKLDTTAPMILTPLRMTYIPVFVQWGRPGLQKGFVQLTTSGGASYTIGIQARVGGSIQSAFNVSAIPLRSGGLPYDTCFTIMSTFYTTVTLGDTAWISRGGLYRITSPALPVMIPPKGTLQLCIHIERAGTPGDDTLLLAINGDDSCAIPFCFAHPISLGGTNAPPPPAGLESITTGGPSFSILPNPLSAHGTIEMRTLGGRRTTLRLLDAGGREVSILYDGTASENLIVVSMSSNGLPSGSYFLVMESGRHRLVKEIAIRR